MLKRTPFSLLYLLLGGVVLLGLLPFTAAHAAAFDCTAVTQIPTADCDALVAVYDAAGGDTWLDNTGWLTESDPCNWYGVTCANGRVTQILLNENQLSGTLAAAIGDLTALETLQMNDNQLTGAIPSSVGNLTQLQWLRLENNQLSGTVPAALGNITQLQYLYLSTNQLSGSIPAELGDLSNLLRLYISNNQLTGAVPSSLGNLGNLTFLLLNNNAGLTGALPLSFTNLGNLDFFHVLNTALCEPADLAFEMWINGIDSFFGDGVQCDGSATDTPTPSSSTAVPTNTPTTPSNTPVPTDTPTPQPAATSDPNGAINYCEGVTITDNRSVTVPQMEKPGHLQPYSDPAFGSDVTRITNAQFGGVIKTAYNTVQAWNSDESYLILYHTGTEDGGHHLYDGQSYDYIRKLDFAPKDLEQFFWDDNEPTTLYYINRTSPDYGDLMRYDVLTDAKTSLTNFDAICGQDSAPTSGNDVQMMSWDGDRIGLRCASASSANPVDLTFYYTISTDETSDTLAIGEGTRFDPWYAAQMAPSGERLILDNAVLDTNMNVVRDLDYGGTEHSSLGRLANGNDALFTVNFNAVPNGCEGEPYSGVGSLTVYDLETGACRTVIGEDNGYGYPLSGVHHSALSRDAAGWVAISSIGYPDQLDLLTNGAAAPVLFSEIYLANTDPAAPVICRLAHHRSYARNAENGDYNGYFGEPHPVLSPSGTRILYSSDWGDSGSVDVYVVELPVHETSSQPVPTANALQTVTATRPNAVSQLLVVVVPAVVVIALIGVGVATLSKRGRIE